MRKLLLIVMVLAFAGTSFGQLSGTFYIPSGGTPSYPSIKAAIADLNSLGVGSGGAIFNVAAGYTETNADSLILTASGRSNGSLTFQKFGTGANPILSRSGAGVKTTSAVGGQGDAVITLDGCDYVVFNGIDISASNAGIEYGYLLRKASASDGCQNVTIKNCNITMNKTGQYVAGIYESNLDKYSLVSASTGVLVQSVSGRNENITITGNTIGNVAMCVLVRGFNDPTAPYDFYDKNVVIGAYGAGNTFNNFGGSTTTYSTYAVNTTYVKNLNVSYNTIDNAGGGGTASNQTMYALSLNSSSNPGGGDYVISNNNFTITEGANSSTIYTIYCLQPCNSVTISQNTFNYGTLPGTGSVYNIYHSSASSNVTITNNSFVGNTSRTGTSGYMYCIYDLGSPTAASEVIANNNFSNVSGGGSSGFYGCYSTFTAPQTKDIYGNIYSGISIGSGTFYGIYCSAGGTANIFQNQLNTISTGGTTNYCIYTGSSVSFPNVYSNSVHGIYAIGASASLYGVYAGSSTTASVYKNSIYDLTSGGATGTAYGIAGISGTNVRVYNNFISELKTPASSNVNAINGIYFSGPTNGSVFYNTVYLNATSSAATFGTSALYSVVGTSIDMRNNILVNKSNHKGNTGYTVVYRRNGAVNTTNYALASNNNDLSVGSNLAYFNYIFYDGTTTGKDSTIAQFKTRVSPRETASFTEDPPFINNTTSPFNLHLTASVQTKCESGGTDISTPLVISDDFDAQPRYPDPNCPKDPNNLPSASDVGADEFGGIPVYTCVTPDPGATLSTANYICFGQGTVTLSFQNVITTTGNSYQWQQSSDSLTFTNITGAISPTYTFAPAVKAWYRCKITCQNGPVSAYSIPLAIRFLYEVTSTTGAERCGTGIVKLFATGTGSQVGWYYVPVGGVSLGTGSPFYSPSIAATTTFYVGAEATSTGAVTIGAGAGTSATYSNPFYSLWSNAHNQHLIPASELIAAGLNGGDITSLGLNITGIGTLPMLDFSLKIGQTTATDLSSFVSTTFQTVYTNSSYMPVAGVNTMPFTTPFTWDGVSNLVIEICHGNAASTATMNRTCLADPTTYISTIHTHVTTSPGTSGTTICGDITSNKTTYSLRPVFIINGVMICTSPRTPVVASVVSPPVLDISPNITICNNSETALTVLSNTTVFDQYIWSPLTDLFSDAACTVPYTGQSALTVYVKSATPGTITYTCTATNTTSFCSNLDQAVVTILPATVQITASPVNLCWSGSSILSVSIPSGTGSATFQWQQSPDGTTFTDIAGATNLVYTTDYIGMTTWYKFDLKNSSGQSCTSAQYQLVVNAPLVTSTTPGFHCGPGTVDLAAAGNTGALTWYDNPNGGTPLGTGPNFTTPYLWASKTYYVSAITPGTILESAGKLSPTGTTSATNNNYGLVFTATQNVNIQSVDIYPAGATGQCAVVLYNSANTLLYGPVYFTYPAGNGTTPYTLPLSFQLQAGTGYKILLSVMSGGNLIRESSGVTYPVSNGTLVSITTGLTALNTTSATYYNWFYNWRVMSGCASPMTPVEATINLAPFYVLSDPQAVCNNEAATLTLQNGSTYYDTFNWSPADNLYTNAACTIPYVLGTNLSTVYLKTSTPGYYEVHGYAHNAVNGCTNYDTTSVVELPATLAIASDPDSLCVSGSAHLTLVPAMNYGASKIQWQVSADGVHFTDIAGATNANYNTGVITTTAWYKVSIVNTNYVECLMAVKKIFVDNPAILSVTPASRCGTGTVDLSATCTPGSVINWYSNPLGGAIIGTGYTFTTPSISATTTFYASAMSGNGGGIGAVGPLDNTIGAGTQTSLSYYEIFDVLASSMTLQGVHVYPGAAGAVKLYIANSAGTVLYNIIDTVTAASIGQKTYIPINVPLPSGTAYRIGYNSTVGGVSLYRNSAGAVYPYTLPGVVSITGNSFSGYPMYFYYCYDWRVSTKCTSPLVPVEATVYPSNPVNITPDRTICPNDIHMLQVTSSVGDYTKYTWSPVYNLYTDDACTLPYLTGTNATRVYFRSGSAIITTYTCHGENTNNGCNSSATSVVTVVPNPTVISIPETICISGTALIKLAPATGYGAATFQWQSSADSLTFTDIPGATNMTYQTPTLTATTYYLLTIKNSLGEVCTVKGYGMHVNNPQLLSTTPGTRCGTGTVLLHATGTGGTIKWYADPNGATQLGTGPDFTTPEISFTTNYYVSCAAGSSSAYVGMPTSTIGTSGVGTTTYGLYFDAIVPFKIYSVVVYPNASADNTAGTVTISVINSAGTVLNQAVVNVTGYVQSTNPHSQRVDLNFDVAMGTGLRLVMSAYSGISGLMFQPTAQGPYPYPYTVPGVVSITSGTYLGTVYPSLYYYFYNWLVSAGCETPKTTVTATVVPGPALGITGDQALCINQAQQLQVTSTLTDFNKYTWTPNTYMYTDAACTIPYVTGTNLTSVYVKPAVAGLIKYRCTGLDTVSLCQNIAESSITTLPVATISSYPENVCVSGSATLNMSPSTGYGAATFQWQTSSDNVTFTNIAGATGTSYNTPVISATTWYRVEIFNTAGTVCSTPSYAMTVNNPQVVTTTPGTRCGIGTVTLGATPSAGAALSWYNVATGGIPLGTGNTFTTPSISTTTNYYVGASLGGMNVNIGKQGIESGAGTGGGIGSYLTFTATQSFILHTVDIFPYGTGPGTVTIAVQSTAGTTLMSQTVNAVGTNSVSSPAQTVVVDFPITPGDYRLTATAWTGGISNIYRDYTGSTTTNYPFPYSFPGVASITGSYLGNYYYYFFYNWQIGTGCSSARTIVTATVTPPPAITPTATPSQICAGSFSGLNVTSGNAGYTYNWMPGNMNGAGQSVSPETTTQYTVTASDAVSQCVNQANVTVTVLPTPTPITITPSYALINPGDIQQLTASGGTLGANGTFGTGTTVNTTTAYPAPYTNYYGGAKHQMLIKASELTAQGLFAGASISSISFFVQTIGSGLTTLSNFQIDMGHTTASVLTSTAFIGGLTNVRPAGTYTLALGTNTHNLTVPFIWNGTDNIIIQTSYSNGNTGTTTLAVQMYQSEAGFVGCNWYRADGLTAAAILTGATPTGSGTARPNMVLGYSSPAPRLWTPNTDLFIDAGATVPYTGQALATVYAKPGMTTTYTCSSTATISGCVRSQSVIVEIINPCMTPGAITPSAITAGSAVISWTEPTTPPGSGYEYEVRTSGAPGSGPAGLVANGTTNAGVTTATITGLLPLTTYHAYVRGNCGDNVYSNWTAGATFTTTVNPLIVTGTVTNVTGCYADQTGAVSTTVTGGIPPYTYLWNNGATTANIAGLTGGYYAVTVTDNAGTHAYNNWTVTQPAVMILSATTTAATCLTSADGSINMTVTGGTTPYTYLWSDGSTTEDLTGVVAGQYDVTVTDSHNCTKTNSWTVDHVSDICPTTTVFGFVASTICYNATQVITVAGTPFTFTVGTTGNASFIAGQKISYLPGTKVLLGGKMTGKIAPNGPWCSQSKMTEVPAGSIEPTLATETASFTLYPNPTNGNFTLVQKGDLTYGNVKVEVFSMSGAKVLTESMIGQKKHEFRFADMPNGLYFVKVVADDYVETIKLVKTR